MKVSEWVERGSPAKHIAGLQALGSRTAMVLWVPLLHLGDARFPAPFGPEWLLHRPIDMAAHPLTLIADPIHFIDHVANPLRPGWFSRRHGTK
jgi:hypothetical protein